MTPPPAPVPPTVSPTASPVSSQSAASPAAASQTLHPATQPLAVVAEKLPWRQTFNSLSIPNFRIFTAGHFVAVIAVWMQRIAQDWLVLQLSGSVTAVGVTAALQFLPSLVLGPWGGALTDRLPKRRILIATQSAAALLAASLAVLALSGRIEVWHCYLIALILGLVTVLDQPARQVFVNELVGPEHLRNAISVNSTVFQLGGLIGPFLAGVLLNAVGAGWAFAINALACCCTVLSLTAMNRDRLHVSAPAPRQKGMVRQAVQYALRKPTIRWPWLMAAFVSLFALSLPVQLAAFADRVYDVGAGGYGLLNAMLALGALLGAVTSTRRRRLQVRSAVFAAGAYGVMLCIASLVPGLAAFCVLMVCTGFCSLLFLTAANQLVQTSSNTAIRGRVMSLYLVVLMGGQALGGPMMGSLAEHFGPHVSLFVSGVVPAVAAAVVSVVLARQGKLRLQVQLQGYRPSFRISGGVTRAADG
ncbi:MFS transporter [Arthrobacter woluwensis]|uniref:Predicted arabinose efflux permease, MFS family n=1 Tax=Arthrobacter woluwensis TaxID=156980 RepID=A0A1H4QLV2_9MICC|nr:MFS transporter [Arthrobacter woluwensis]SEC20481.1 Predicted arabinose efflux permease, MFS family [Arthrobacter woluwensis]